jgi:hypothetical protein
VTLRHWRFLHPGQVSQFKPPKPTPGYCLPLCASRLESPVEEWSRRHTDAPHASVQLRASGNARAAPSALECKHVEMPDRGWRIPKGRHGGTPTVIGCLLALLLVLCAACGSDSTGSSAPASSRNPGTAGLRAAARAWSDAFLTGTVADIRNMEGASCQSGTPTLNPTLLEGYLRGMRAEMERHVGVPLGSIRSTGVLVRNVTAITGEAEVEYALPPSVVGNDNWVTYQYQRGQWKETNCHAPIGGASQSVTASRSNL